MLKFLIIVCVITYVIYKIASFFFRAGAASQHLRDIERDQKRNVNGQGERDKARKGKFKDGEYIDYEEVK